MLYSLSWPFYIQGTGKFRFGGSYIGLIGGLQKLTYRSASWTYRVPDTSDSGFMYRTYRVPAKTDLQVCMLSFRVLAS